MTVVFSGGQANGPCVFEPNAKKGNVKKHLMTRHALSDEEARMLLAALAPEVRH